jgi:hypothetical protein
MALATASKALRVMGLEPARVPELKILPARVLAMAGWDRTFSLPVAMESMAVRVETVPMVVMALKVDLMPPV